ncbi:hypothetical protein BDW66DRAFT_163891 [Aspergillus desertorum]
MKLIHALPAILPFAVSSSAAQVSSYVGCFSTAGSFQNLGTNVFQTVDYCINQCMDAGYSRGDYAAVKESSCYCGDVDPAKDELVDDDQCTAQCPGMLLDCADDRLCGGNKTWSLYVIGEAWSDLWSNSTSSSTTNTFTDVTSVALSATAASTEASTSASPIEAESTSETVAASSSAPASVSSLPTSASTSIEPTPTGNSASRRYSFLF